MNYKNCLKGCILWIIFFLFGQIVSSQMHSQGSQKESYHHKQRRSRCPGTLQGLLGVATDVLFPSNPPSSLLPPSSNPRSSSSKLGALPQQQQTQSMASLVYSTAEDPITRIRAYNIKHRSQTACFNPYNYRSTLPSSKSLLSSSPPSLNSTLPQNVQLFVFFFPLPDTKENQQTNLRILVESQPDEDRTRILFDPVVVLLKSCEPKRFQLYLVSFLTKTKQPIHIILKQSGSSVMFADEHMPEAALLRVQVSVLEARDSLTTEGCMGRDLDSVDWLQQLSISALTQVSGLFPGRPHNLVGPWPEEGVRLLPTANRVRVRVVLVYKLRMAATRLTLRLGIDLVLLGNILGVPVNWVETDLCRSPVSESLLQAVVSTSQPILYNTDPTRSCVYKINQHKRSMGRSEPTFSQVAWIHLDSVQNRTIELNLITRPPSTDWDEQQKTRHYLLVVTAAHLLGSQFSVVTANLHHRVVVLTNASSIQNRWLFTPWGLSTVIRLTRGPSQHQKLQEYLSRADNASVQLSMFELPLNKILFNVILDDSEILKTKKLFSSISCWESPESPESVVRVVFNQSLWRLANDWLPPDGFYLGRHIDGEFNCDCRFRHSDLYKPELLLATCPFDRDNKDNFALYGLWDKTWLMLYRHSRICRSTKSLENNKITCKIKNSDIPRSQSGFLVTNDSAFKYPIKSRITNGSEFFVQLTGDLVNSPYMLNECFLTEQRISEAIVMKRRLRKVQLLLKSVSNNSRNYAGSMIAQMEQWYRLLDPERNLDQTRPITVHLYCQVTKCSYVKLEGLRECQPTSDPSLLYYGAIVVSASDSFSLSSAGERARHSTKITVIIVLSVSVVLLLLCLLLSLCHVLSCRRAWHQTLLLPQSSHHSGCGASRRSKQLTCHVHLPVQCILPQPPSLQTDNEEAALVPGQHHWLLAGTTATSQHSLLPSADHCLGCHDDDDKMSLVLRATYISCAASSGASATSTEHNVAAASASGSVAVLGAGGGGPSCGTTRQISHSWPPHPAIRGASSLSSSSLSHHQQQHYQQQHHQLQHNSNGTTSGGDSLDVATSQQQHSKSSLRWSATTWWWWWPGWSDASHDKPLTPPPPLPALLRGFEAPSVTRH